MTVRKSNYFNSILSANLGWMTTRTLHFISYGDLIQLSTDPIDVHHAINTEFVLHVLFCQKNQSIFHTLIDAEDMRRHQGFALRTICYTYNNVLHNGMQCIRCSSSYGRRFRQKCIYDGMSKVIISTTCLHRTYQLDSTSTNPQAKMPILTDTIILSVCSSALNGTNPERRVQVVSRTSKKNYSNSRIDFRTTATTNDGKDNRIDTKDFKCIAVSIYNDITQSNYMRVFVWMYSEISNITVDTYGFAAKENEEKEGLNAF